MSKHIMFCLLRNRTEYNVGTENQMNIPLYFFQKNLMSAKNSKAFVYQTNKGTTVIDFGRLPVDTIYYADARCEAANYADTLITAFCTVYTHQQQEKYRNDEHELLILMEQNIVHSDVVVFLDRMKHFLEEYHLLPFSVRLIYNHSSHNPLHESLKQFIMDRSHYASGCRGDISTFEEYASEDDL